MFRNKHFPFVFLALLVATALFVAGCTAATSAAPSAQSTQGNGTITVVGKGQAFGQPDQAQIQVGVETFAQTVDEATSQNQATVDAVMAALDELGIPAKDIQTTNYSLFAEQRYGDNGPEGIAGYRVGNQVNVIVRDISQVGAVMAAVTDAGANSIYGVNFSVADPAALEQEARAAAMADAQERAEALASLGQVQLGGITAISEVVGPPPVVMGLGGGAMAEAAAPQPSISPGELAVNVQVQVEYAIQ